MILNTDKPNVTHSGTPVRRIDMNDMVAASIAVMVENSRDGFYSNKELAPIREYSTNARDSHIQSGIPTRPIEVTLPTIMEPELKIRDFGKGLTIDQLTDVYFKYWKSTKRNSNTQNGCLGIGAKSAFAYAPFYTVTTWCDGMKTVANGQKNGFADIIFHQENTENEEQGVEITIPIQAKDIEKFILEALEFFKHWDIRPIFHNIDEDRLKPAFSLVDTAPFLSGEGWAVRPAGYGNGETKAVMSFIPYTIDWKQVQNSIAPELLQKIGGVFTFLQENLTTLWFENGTLSFTPNRESLQYNETTVNELSKKLTAIYDSLLNLITSKVSDASNLWEAKIRYNMIFRKELDGFDKAFVYGGNLQTIEGLLRNRIQWNGITITNGLFEGLDSWCADEGKVGTYHDGDYSPVLTTYVKSDDRTNVVTVKQGRGRRRRYYQDSKIICSPKSVVVIQDTDKESLAKGFARWIFYKSGMDVAQVYVLNLAKTETKDDFYKEYNFDTVPVKSVRDNELLIKAYLKSIRAPRSSSGLPRESRPLNCPYMTIENRRSRTYVSGTYWRTEDVNARGLDGGGYYVVYTKSSFSFNGVEIPHDAANLFWQSIYDLALVAGVDLPKVYGIHPKTAESVWFKQAVEDGDWTNLSEFVKENSDSLPTDILIKMDAYNTADENRIGILAAKELLPLLSNPNGVAGKFFDEISEFIKYWNTKDIASCLRIKGCDADETEVERFKTMNAEMRKKYPLLFKTCHHSSIERCTGDASPLDFPTIRELAEYINLVDAKV